MVLNCDTLLSVPLWKLKVSATMLPLVKSRVPPFRVRMPVPLPPSRIIPPTVKLPPVIVTVPFMLLPDDMVTLLLTVREPPLIFSVPLPPDGISFAEEKVVSSRAC